MQRSNLQPSSFIVQIINIVIKQRHVLGKYFDTEYIPENVAKTMVQNLIMWNSL